MIYLILLYKKDVTNPFEGLHITLNSGESCYQTDSNITNYSMELYIICDYKNETTLPIEFLPEYFEDFHINKCRNTLVALSKSGDFIFYIKFFF